MPRHHLSHYFIPPNHEEKTLGKKFGHRQDILVRSLIPLGKIVKVLDSLTPSPDIR